MYTAHRNLHPERKKTEGNPCPDSIVYSFKNGNRFRVVEVINDNQWQPIKISVQLAVSKDAKIHEDIPIDDFWKYFTTREYNLENNN
jgi:hypothetical protein